MLRIKEEVVQISRLLITGSYSSHNATQRSLLLNLPGLISLRTPEITLMTILCRLKILIHDK